MKTVLLFFGVLALMTSCDSDTNNFDLDKDPLKGTIGGKSWTFETGNAEYRSNLITGLLIAQEVQDPCGVRSTIHSHLSVELPAGRGNYNLPFVNNYGYVKFHIGEGASYTATSGFIEVVALSGTEVIGYVSADFDDNNHVQGSFLLQVCN